MKEKDPGTLYLVATPMGNLEDISIRAIKTLQEVDLIAAEDTRHTLKLLNHYNIKKPLTSYFEHNKRQSGEKLIKELSSGKSIALVTDAGTPGISDPGEDLVKLAIDNNIKVTMIPGCTASIMGLVLSGLPCAKFSFEGFLPHERKQRKKLLEELRDEKRTIIFYISPHRVIDVLNDIIEILGDRRAALCRELTKIHEEVIRGHLGGIVKTLSEKEKIKGEMVLVIEGSDKGREPENSHLAGLSISEHMDYYMSKGFEQKNAMKKVASDRGISKREVYSHLIKNKR
ncbi:MAG: 16S rRNA (cytidine(1402)-2'-O)-methyltransferase [Clostridiaceae bacterium]|jgi:16S rRNA (cytidine1402-2'-O)-methyltransferase|nr:16S rRNA (cytidine(1402)-2'-O)-methyltransferase [Clostridiaceae bacterium]